MLQNPRKQARNRLLEKFSPGRRWLASVRLAVAVFVAYFLAARLGLSLQTQPDGVAVFWPAAGLAAGILIGFGVVDTATLRWRLRRPSRRHQPPLISDHNAL